MSPTFASSGVPSPATPPAKSGHVPPGPATTVFTISRTGGGRSLTSTSAVSVTGPTGPFGPSPTAPAVLASWPGLSRTRSKLSAAASAPAARSPIVPSKPAGAIGSATTTLVASPAPVLRTEMQYVTVSPTSAASGVPSPATPPAKSGHVPPGPATTVFTISRTGSGSAEIWMRAVSVTGVSAPFGPSPAAVAVFCSGVWPSATTRSKLSGAASTPAARSPMVPSKPAGAMGSVTTTLLASPAPVLRTEMQ